MFSFLLFALTISDPSLPIWPKKYRIKGRWVQPYQKLSEPILIYTENTTQNKRQALIYYEGVQKQIHFLNGRTYVTQPATNGEISCRYSSFNTSSGQTDDFIHFLPDDDSLWKYNGTEVILGKQTNRWIQTNVQNVDRWYYIFYTDFETNDPIRFYMHGRSIMNSHPTDYYIEIDEFGPSVDETAFVVPATGCVSADSVGPVLNSSPKVNGRHRNFGLDVSMKRNILEAVEYCENMSDVYPNKQVQSLPKTFTWRSIKNVLNMPRDQGTCGSCWAESIANAISAQFAIYSAKPASATQISVQQIVDCTWSPQSHACLGGAPDESLHMLISNRTILVNEEEYPYIGVAGKCRNTTTAKSTNPIGRVTRCLRTERRNRDQLKNALYLYGPLSVTIIADLFSFVEYDGKTIYKDPKCSSDLEQNLDHCVLLTGWKEFENGEWAWEIQNSWSDTWGDNGYGYISSEFEYDCGMTLYPFLPIVEILN